MAAEGFEIVDSHHHLWDLENHGEHYKWINEIPADHKLAPLKRSYLLEHFKRDHDGLNITQSVHVQGEWRGNEVGETEWLSQMADASPDGFPHAIIGYVDLSEDDAAEKLDAHCKFHRFRGIRQLLNWHETDTSKRVADRDYLSDQRWRDRFSLLQDRSLLFELHMSPWQAEQTAALAQQWPDVQFVLNHVGCPAHRSEGVEEWRKAIDILAAQPNMVCKISGLIHPMHTTHGEWDTEALRHWVEYVLAAFKPSRCLFASNFPVDGVCGTYKDVVAAVKTIFDTCGITAEDQRLIFAENAKKLYRIK